MDAVARPILQVIQQFNGKFWCTWCIQQTSSINYCHVYEYSDEPGELRTHKSIEPSANLCDKIWNKFVDNIQGVKYKTLFFNCRKFDVVNEFVFDYMNTINIGITAKLFRY